MTPSPPDVEQSAVGRARFQPFRHVATSEPPDSRQGAGTTSGENGAMSEGSEAVPTQGLLAVLIERHPDTGDVQMLCPYCGEANCIADVGEARRWNVLDEIWDNDGVIHAHWSTDKVTFDHIEYRCTECDKSVAVTADLQHSTDESWPMAAARKPGSAGGQPASRRMCGHTRRPPLARRDVKDGPGCTQGCCRGGDSDDERPRRPVRAATVTTGHGEANDPLRHVYRERAHLVALLADISGSPFGRRTRARPPRRDLPRHA